MRIKAGVLGGISFLLLIPCAFAQVGPAEAVRINAEAIAREDAARAANAAAKRQYSIMKRQNLALLKEFQRTIVPLDSQALSEWTKKKGPRNEYWQYDIKRNKATLASAYYSPKVGYVVNDKWQKNGLGWATLDEALEAKFGKDGVWTLPDIPGWSKAHLLTSEEQIADMKRRVAERAKPLAIDKMAGGFADEIVKGVGDRVTGELAEEFGFAKKQLGKIEFKRLDEDADKVRFGTADSSFQIHQMKDGGAYILLANDGKGGWHRYDVPFESFDSAVEFASEKHAGQAAAAKKAEDEKKAAPKAKAGPKGAPAKSIGKAKTKPVVKGTEDAAAKNAD